MDMKLKQFAKRVIDADVVCPGCWQPAIEGMTTCKDPGCGTLHTAIARSDLDAISLGKLAMHTVAMIAKALGKAPEIDGDGTHSYLWKLDFKVNGRDELGVSFESEDGHRLLTFVELRKRQPNLKAVA